MIEHNLFNWLMGNQIDIIDDLGICSLYDPKFSKAS